jgi:hypothetical protein
MFHLKRRAKAILADAIDLVAWRFGYHVTAMVTSDLPGIDDFWIMPGLLCWAAPIAPSACGRGGSLINWSMVQTSRWSLLASMSPIIAWRLTLSDGEGWEAMAACASRHR